MKTEALNPNIIRIACHQTMDDEHYGSCLWAYYDFDLDRYMLNIQSDCGNAAYKWVETPGSESFLHLMARVDDGYLMYKLFSPEQLDVDATLANVRERLGIVDDEGPRWDYLNDEEREELEEAMDELEGLLNDCGSPEHAIHVLNDWDSDNGIGIDCIYECVDTDYTAGQKRIVEIFTDYVQPKIREMVREAETHGSQH